MMHDASEHRCLDAAEVVRLTPTDAYKRASDCPLCKELVDYVVREKGLRRLRNSLTTDVSPRLDRATVDALLDTFNLPRQRLVMYKFTDVISKTLAALKPGERVKLVSMGELLEAHHPFAFSQVAHAVERGVKFEYQIAVEAKSEQDDATILREGLARSLGSDVVRSHVEVQYDALSLLDRKDIIYFNAQNQPKSTLVELSYREEEPEGISSRLWLSLPEEKRADFIKALEAASNPGATVAGR